MTTLPGYRDLTPLGRGGYSEVFRAYQEQFDRWVAVKLLTFTLTDDRAQQRFLRECRVAGRVSAHPNIVTVYDAGLSPDGRPYLAMQLYDQGSISDRLRSTGPFEVADVLRIAVALAGALESSHRAGVLHRDVKPGNVMLAAYGQPALTDFRLSIVAERQEVSTGVDAMSPHYAPPEVLEDGRPTPRGDVYSLASTVYAMLAGRAPHQVPGGSEDSLGALLNRIVHEDAAPLIRPDVPPSLDVAVRAALARDPRARTPTAVGFAQDLQQIQRELGLEVTEPIVLDPPPEVASPPAPPMVVGAPSTPADSPPMPPPPPPPVVGAPAGVGPAAPPLVPPPPPPPPVVVGASPDAGPADPPPPPPLPPGAQAPVLSPLSLPSVDSDAGAAAVPSGPLHDHEEAAVGSTSPPASTDAEVPSDSGAPPTSDDELADWGGGSESAPPPPDGDSGDDEWAAPAAAAPPPPPAIPIGLAAGPAPQPVEGPPPAGDAATVVRPPLDDQHAEPTRDVPPPAPWAAGEPVPPPPGEQTMYRPPVVVPPPAPLTGGQGPKRTWMLVVGLALLLLVSAIAGIVIATRDGDESAGGGGRRTTTTTDAPSTTEPATTAPRDEPATTAPAPPQPLVVTDVAAPSTAPDGFDACQTTTSFGAGNLVDGEPTTAWRMNGDGSGQTLTITLDGEHTVRSVGLLPGYAKVDPCDGTDRFTQNRRPTSVTWIFDDGTEVPQPLRDAPEMQSVDVDDVTTRTIQLRIDGVTGAPGRDFTAISELNVQGT